MNDLEKANNRFLDIKRYAELLLKENNPSKSRALAFLQSIINIADNICNTEDIRTKKRCFYQWNHPGDCNFLDGPSAYTSTLQTITPPRTVEMASPVMARCVMVDEVPANKPDIVDSYLSLNERLQVRLELQFKLNDHWIQITNHQWFRIRSREKAAANKPGRLLVALRSTDLTNGGMTVYCRVPVMPEDVEGLLPTPPEPMLFESLDEMRSPDTGKLYTWEGGRSLPLAVDAVGGGEAQPMPISPEESTHNFLKPNVLSLIEETYFIHGYAITGLQDEDGAIYLKKRAK